MLKYLLTGTGRCGTVYYAQLLNRVGISCGHESIFTKKGIGEAVARLKSHSPIAQSEISLKHCELPSKIDADSSYMSAPYLDHDILKKTKIIHLVRHPYKVINSFVKMDYFAVPNPEDYSHQSMGGNSWQVFIYNHLPELREAMGQYERAALYWTRWNKMILSFNNSYLHRVELGIAPLLRELNIDFCEFEGSLNSLGSDFTNRVADGIIRDEMVELAEDMGYSMHRRIFL